MNAWFRVYSEFATDAKVRTMPEALQLRLVWLFCLRCSGPTERLSEDEIKYALSLNDVTFHETLQVFQDKGFIDENWRVLNWSKRQFVSDSSTPRVTKHRAKRGMKQDETLQKRSETQNVTDQNRTEQIQSRAEQTKDGPTVEEIILAHPTPTSRKMTALALPTSWLSAAVDALAAGETREGLLAKVQAIAGIVQGWPPGDMRFLKSVDRFFRESEFNKPLAEWRENGANRSNTSVTDHNREAGERALAELRRGRNAATELPGRQSPSESDGLDIQDLHPDFDAVLRN